MIVKHRRDGHWSGRSGSTTWLTAAVGQENQKAQIRYIQIGQVSTEYVQYLMHGRYSWHCKGVLFCRVRWALRFSLRYPPPSHLPQVSGCDQFGCSSADKRDFPIRASPSNFMAMFIVDMGSAQQHKGSCPLGEMWAHVSASCRTIASDFCGVVGRSQGP